MSEKEYNDALVKKIIAETLRVKSLMNKSYGELASEIKKYNFKNPAKFSWSKETKLEGKIEMILGRMAFKMRSEIEAGVIRSWALASIKNDELVKKYLGPTDIDSDILESYLKTNTDALNAFIRRTDSNQYNLSKRVWELTRETKAQLKHHIASGIATGKSAAEVSRDVRGILKEPNRLFRRVRDADGKLVLSKPARAYKPGAGVYRSSYKNALRLAATEMNIAYRSSDHLRRAQLPFVVGVKVNLSGRHNVYDICDYKKGTYPKGFRFVGWHPHCLCYTTSVLMKKDKFLKYLQTGKVDQRLLVRKIPIKAERYVLSMKEKLEGRASKPYWLENYDKDFKLKSNIGIARNDVDLYKKIPVDKGIVNKKVTPFQKVS